jgi:hypothetical protein
MKKKHVSVFLLVYNGSMGHQYMTAGQICQMQPADTFLLVFIVFKNNGIYCQHNKNGDFPEKSDFPASLE